MKYNQDNEWKVLNVVLSYINLMLGNQINVNATTAVTIFYRLNV